MCDSWVDQPNHNAEVHRLSDRVLHKDTQKNEEALDLLVEIASSLADTAADDRKHGQDCLGKMLHIEP